MERCGRGVQGITVHLVMETPLTQRAPKLRHLTYRLFLKSLGVLAGEIFVQ